MEKYEIKSYKYENGCWVGSIHMEDMCAAISARDELNRLVDKINQANKLIAAVKAGYHGENYCEDVDGANWFDLAEEFLKENK